MDEEREMGGDAWAAQRERGKVARRERERSALADAQTARLPSLRQMCSKRSEARAWSEDKTGRGQWGGRGKRGEREGGKEGGRGRKKGAKVKDQQRLRDERRVTALLTTYPHAHSVTKHRQKTRPYVLSHVAFQE